MENLEKFVLAVNNGKNSEAKDLLEKVLKDKVAKKIKDTLKDTEKNQK